MNTERPDNDEASGGGDGSSAEARGAGAVGADDVSGAEETRGSDALGDETSPAVTPREGRATRGPIRAAEPKAPRKPAPPEARRNTPRKPVPPEARRNTPRKQRTTRRPPAPRPMPRPTRRTAPRPPAPMPTLTRHRLPPMATARRLPAAPASASSPHPTPLSARTCPRAWTPVSIRLSPRAGYRRRGGGVRPRSRSRRRRPLRPRRTPFRWAPLPGRRRRRRRCRPAGRGWWGVPRRQYRRRVRRRHGLRRVGGRHSSAPRARRLQQEWWCGERDRPREPNPYGVTYRVDGSLPEGPNSAPVYRTQGQVTEDDVARLAGALGVDGTPVAQGQVWRVGARDGSGPSLQVNRQAPGAWTFQRYSPVIDNCDSATVCGAEQTPPDLR